MPTTGNGLNPEAKVKGSSLGGGGGYGMPYSNYKTVKCKYFDQGIFFKKTSEIFEFVYFAWNLRNLQIWRKLQFCSW